MLSEFYFQAKDEGRPCHATYILSGTCLPEDTSTSLKMDTFDPMDIPLASQESTKSNKSNSSTNGMFRKLLLVDENDLEGLPYYSQFP
jgi:hypothetical protein